MLLFLVEKGKGLHYNKKHEKYEMNEIQEMGNCDVAQDAQTTAGTLALPSARNGRIKGTEVRGACQSTASKRRRLQSALLVVRRIPCNCYMKSACSVKEKEEKGSKGRREVRAEGK